MSCHHITGPIGDLRCGCHDPQACLKDKNAARLTLTPACFTYHTRWSPSRTVS